MKKMYKKEHTVETVAVNEIDSRLFRKKAVVSGRIEKVFQTGGPTVFTLEDGTGSLSLKGFVAPGERAHPELEMGNYVKAQVTVDEFNGEIEGNIDKITKLDGEKAERIGKDIEYQQRNRAKIVNTEFMTKSLILDKLKDTIFKAAEEIRLAIVQGRPIVVRHHNDTDGYCSGFALEKAIVPLIEKQNTNPKAAWESFRRAPCMAPYYELEDSIKDTANSLRGVAKFGEKMPLIIIVDNGSSPEDLMAIQQGKIHGAEFIVIDHHGFDKDVITKEVLAHINPELVEESGANFSAGMLCAEIGRIINEDVENMEQIPALAGYADRIDISNPELMKEYLKIAETRGYDKQLLADISLVIEYVSTKLRFMESREYIEVLFGEPREQQKKLVSLMAPHIRGLDKKGLAIGKSSAEIEKFDKVTLQTIQIEKSFPGFGFFPKPGRSVGLLHDNLQVETKVTSLVSVGIMNTAMTFRATDEAKFSMHEMITRLQEKLPNAFVDGGGHKNAGAINFIPKMKEEVWEVVKNYIMK
jgi:archaea-specific RecJ-like exonuclease